MTSNNLLKVIRRCSLFLFVIALSSTANDPKLSGSSWLSQFQDQKVASLNGIPGTHNSACGPAESFFEDEGFTVRMSAKWLWYGYQGQNQEMTIAQQLESGVRFLDFRIVENKNELRIAHTWVSTHWDLVFRNVLSVVDDFLKRNPTEFVILRVSPDTPSDAAKQATDRFQENWGPPGVYLPWSFLASSGDYDNVRTGANPLKVADAIKSHGGSFFDASVVPTPTPHLDHLKVEDLAGKMYITTKNHALASACDGKCHSLNDSGMHRLHDQLWRSKFYKKWKAELEVHRLLNNTGDWWQLSTSYFGGIMLSANFSFAAGVSGGFEEFAAGLRSLPVSAKTLLQDFNAWFFKISSGFSHVGLIAVDFITKEDIRKILEKN